MVGSVRGTADSRFPRRGCGEGEGADRAFAQPAALHAGSGNDILPDPARSGAAPSGRRLASFPAATNGSAVQLAVRLSPLLARLQFFRARVSASGLPFRVSFRSSLLFAWILLR